mmetsp:Transcript_88698/g.264652  ORF Transcript_88698/g.264652 Transcript_88698/m.264652 type:complete len:314 (+) Transcript_88698:365-1306(+)
MGTELPLRRARAPARWGAARLRGRRRGGLRPRPRQRLALPAGLGVWSSEALPPRVHCFLAGIVQGEGLLLRRWSQLQGFRRLRSRVASRAAACGRAHARSRRSLLGVHGRSKPLLLSAASPGGARRCPRRSLTLHAGAVLNRQCGPTQPRGTGHHDRRRCTQGWRSHLGHQAVRQTRRPCQRPRQVPLQRVVASALAQPARAGSRRVPRLDRRCAVAIALGLGAASRLWPPAAVSWRQCSCWRGSAGVACGRNFAAALLRLLRRWQGYAGLLGLGCCRWGRQRGGRRLRRGQRGKVDRGHVRERDVPAGLVVR